MWIILQGIKFQRRVSFGLTIVLLFIAGLKTVPLAQNAPFLNTTLTNNFQTEKDKGSRRPIFEIKRILLKERLICHLWCVDLSWVIRVFENRSWKWLTQKNDRILSIFRYKWIMLLFRKIVRFRWILKIHL